MTRILLGFRPGQRGAYGSILASISARSSSLVGVVVAHTRAPYRIAQFIANSLNSTGLAASVWQQNMTNTVGDENGYGWRRTPLPVSEKILKSSPRRLTLLITLSYSWCRTHMTDSLKSPFADIEHHREKSRRGPSTPTGRPVTLAVQCRRLVGCLAPYISRHIERSLLLVGRRIRLRRMIANKICHGVADQFPNEL